MRQLVVCLLNDVEKPLEYFSKSGWNSLYTALESVDDEICKDLLNELRSELQEETTEDETTEDEKTEDEKTEDETTEDETKAIDSTCVL